MFTAADEQALEGLGARLARACGGGGCRIYLRGELGAGKTTLVRGFLRGLGYQGRVKSPTYTLVEPYEVGGGAVYHLDLYRLADAEELEWIGGRDLFADETAVSLVEWPERGRGALPPADLEVIIDYLDRGRRVAMAATTARGRDVLAQLGPETSTRS
ncbi:MAG: tRNA (adenosine(37)-N6)-threonylcarbamoyltransferase complex ATPase subunit type 1 TsaE [Gammaproteobacteria bacterium]